MWRPSYAEDLWTRHAMIDYLRDDPKMPGNQTLVFPPIDWKGFNSMKLLLDAFRIWPTEAIQIWQTHFTETPSIRAVAKILRAPASEPHLLFQTIRVKAKFCQHFQIEWDNLIPLIMCFRCLNFSQKQILLEITDDKRKIMVSCWWPLRF